MKRFHVVHCFLIYIVLSLFTGCILDDEEIVAVKTDYDINGTVIHDGVYTDKRNNRDYPVIGIASSYRGTKYWFAKNLDYVDSSDGALLIKESWCYDDDETNCLKYGRLYSWEAANKACPDGWHLPTKNEWVSLRDSVDKKNFFENPGTSLKSIDGWVPAESISGGKNRFGFNGLPGGRKSKEGGFLPAGKFGYFWSSAVNSDTTASGWVLSYESEHLLEGDYYKMHGMSVRCVTDDNYSAIHVEGKLDASYLDEIPVDYGEPLEYQGQSYRTVYLDGRRWMAENMNYETGNSWCYENKEANCEEYGRLYDMETALTVCPEGWHLIRRSSQKSENEAGLLEEMDFRELSVKGHCDRHGVCNAHDLWGFNMKFSGFYENQGRDDFLAFSSLGGREYYWVQSASSGELQNVGFGDVGVFTYPDARKEAYSIRCVED